jgi:hypothetical protein
VSKKIVITIPTDRINYLGGKVRKNLEKLAEKAEAASIDLDGRLRNADAAMIDATGKAADATEKFFGQLSKQVRALMPTVEVRKSDSADSPPTPEEVTAAAKVMARARAASKKK